MSSAYWCDLIEPRQSETLVTLSLIVPAQESSPEEHKCDVNILRGLVFSLDKLIPADQVGINPSQGGLGKA